MFIGIGTPITLGQGGGVSYEAEATALFARFTTPPTATRKGQINTLIKALKAAGVWSKLDALYLFAAADSQAARQNWIQDLYNATAVSSPTFTADRGYNGDAAASYVDSNFNPATASSPKFVQNSAYFAFWSRTAASTTGSVAGYYDGANGVTRQPRTAADDTAGRINQTLVSASSGTGLTDASGLIGAARSASNALRLSRNGGDLFTDGTVSAAVANGTLRYGNFGTAAYAATQFAAGLIGQNLSVAEESAAYTALLTYMQAVGAA